MNCPLCLDQTLVLNYRSSIEIDVCPQCKGVWPDRGGIDKLVGVVSAPPKPAVSAVVQPGKEKSVKEQAKQKKKKKTSLGDRLGDILEDVLDL